MNAKDAVLHTQLYYTNAAGVFFFICMVLATTHTTHTIPVMYKEGRQNDNA